MSVWPHPDIPFMSPLLPHWSLCPVSSLQCLTWHCLLSTPRPPCTQSEGQKLNNSTFWFTKQFLSPLPGTGEWDEGKARVPLQITPFLPIPNRTLRSIWNSSVPKAFTALWSVVLSSSELSTVFYFLKHTCGTCISPSLMSYFWNIFASRKCAGCQLHVCNACSHMCNTLLCILCLPS